MTKIDKNVTLIKTAGTGDCYIIKDVNENNLMKKGVLRIVQELSKKQLLYIVGEFGINYCGDVSSYLVQEKISKKDDNFNDVRRRRHEDPQKLPNCKDILLDCTPNLIGKTTECGTWRDQQMNMERVCLSPTEFQITLHKPSEMMANKLHDETRLLCIERIRNGLSC
uniref:Protein kinase domain-containing protein n=1 Tax=Parastrongyloides trichosuri TaxID=131310 RepID=A0A0N4Z7N4_PARTI